MEVWVVPLAYEGGLQGAWVFDSYGKAEKWVKVLEKEYAEKERLDLFIKKVEVK